MKKFMKAVLIVLAILVAGFMTYKALQLIGMGKAFSKNVPDMTKEELTLCLNQNKDKFESVSKIFDKYPSVLEIAGHDKFGKGNKGKFYYATKNKLYIESKEKLESAVIDEIDNSIIKLIFSEIKFESMMQMEDCIYFIQGSNLAYASGIVYSPKKEKPGYEYLIQLEKIDDKWFYFRFK